MLELDRETFTDKGMLLLEANLSCNFFRGSFDKAQYFAFVDEYFRYVQGVTPAPIVDGKAG